MPDILANLKETVAELEFARDVRRSLVSVRLINESDRETLDRVLKLANKMICPQCRGYGHTIMSSTCRACDGSGLRGSNEPTSTG